MPTPLATYRLQLHSGFDFDAATAIAPYLRDLGVSHAYCSPYLQAAAGSTHGYDVTDPSQVNEELGGEAGHARFCRALAEAGLGQVLDIVPNHMSIDPRGGPRNAWWWDVLENGPASRYAAYFDVDWDPPQSRLRNTVLLPILGDHYGRVLEAGELQLVRRGGGFEIHYHEHRLPVAPRSLDTLLAEAARRCGSPDLAFLADALGRLPISTATDRESVLIRHRDKEVLRGQLDRLAAEKPEVAAAVDALVAEVNADPDRLDALLDRQNYRPAFWRTAGRELDYRRFFDVHSLVGLRTEDERVFSDTHARALDWVARGVVDGLRIDHPDGLYDPKGYFERLRNRAPGAYLVAEKILAPGEALPADWPIEGTTGYDFLNLVGGLFVDPAGEEPLGRLWAKVSGEKISGEKISGESLDWPAILHEKKQLVLEQLLASDVNRLAEVFLLVCERHRRHRDHTRHTEDWAAAVRRWMAANEKHWRGSAPDRSAEYLLYQTLVGAWPIGIERLSVYLEKALREAKRKTSWTRPDPAYEAAVRGFAEGLLGDAAFLADLEAFVAPLVAPGRIHSLSQVLLKLTAPGVPDFYQGSELWDLSLVDPDNRRPVDYDLRRRLLAELAAGPSPEAILARADEGLPKLWLIRQALHLRRRTPELFSRGSTYHPLAVEGPRADHAVAFTRGERVVTVAPRLVMRLGGDWAGTTVELPPGRFVDELTGEEVQGGHRPVADLLARFPVALLGPLG